jgi:hypothetical protein
MWEFVGAEESRAAWSGVGPGYVHPHPAMMEYRLTGEDGGEQILKPGEFGIVLG